MHYCVAGGPQALQPVEAMLAVASHPANEIAEMSYTFWYRLSRNLTSSFVSAQHAPNQQVYAIASNITYLLCGPLCEYLLPSAL